MVAVERRVWGAGGGAGHGGAVGVEVERSMLESKYRRMLKGHNVAVVVRSRDPHLGVSVRRQRRRMDRVWLWVEERGSKGWWWYGGGGGRILMREEPKGWLTRTCFLEDRDIGHEKDRVFTAGGGGRGWRWWFVGGSSGGACRACSVGGGVLGRRRCSNRGCFGRRRRGLSNGDSGWLDAD